MSQLITKKGKQYFKNPRTKNLLLYNGTTHYHMWLGGIYKGLIPEYTGKLKEVKALKVHRKKIKDETVYEPSIKPSQRTIHKYKVKKNLEDMTVIQLWKKAGHKGKVKKGTKKQQLINIIKNQ